MKHRLLYIFVTYLLSFKGYSQDIIFDKTFQPTKQSELDFGQTITLQGNVETTIEEIEITVNDGISIKTETVKTQSGVWNSSIGPFIPNTNISITFKTIKYLNDKTEEIHVAINKSLDVLKENIQKEDLSFSNDELIAYAAKIFRKQFPSEYANYKNAAEKNALDYIVDNLLSSPDSIIHFYNYLSAKEKIEKNINKDLAKMRDSLKNSNDESLKKGFSEISVFIEKDQVPIKNQILAYNPNLTALIEKLTKEKDAYNNVISKSDSVMTFIANQVKDFSKTEFVAIKQTTKKLESDLTQYAGFDASALAFSQGDLSSVGAFFTVSPYFKKINMNAEVKWRNPLTYITPTIGFSFASLKSTREIKPIFYVGGSIRFNKIFRVTMGDAFYIDTSMHHLLATGVSININYLGEFLKIFSSISQGKPTLNVK
jgi:hypothetical protein